MELTLYEHWNELRKRLLLIFIFLIVFFIVGFAASNFFIKGALNDLIITDNVNIIGLTPLEYILTQLKVGFVISIILTMPVLIYELLVFIKPGLNKKEKNAIKLILPTFTLLFLMGIVFSYFIFLPVGIYFLANFSKGIIENMWSIDRFFNFVLLTCLSFAFIFQLPLLLAVLNKLGIINARKLKKYRAHIYVLIFLIAALITPTTDAISLIIVSLPLIVLYEVSMLVVR